MSDFRELAQTYLSGPVSPIEMLVCGTLAAGWMIIHLLAPYLKRPRHRSGA